MKNKSMLEIVKELRSRGNRVGYRNRSDGGIIITSINGVKYTRAGTGNKVAREMTGANISEARRIQLINITKGSPKSRQETARRKREGSNEELVKELSKMVRKINRETRKNEKESGKAGYVSVNKVRYLLKTEGREEAERRLSERYKYAKGLAYSKNINYLLQRLTEFAKLNPNKAEETQEIYDLIKNNAHKIREEDIYAIYQAIYRWVNGKMTTEELLAFIRSRLSN